MVQCYPVKCYAHNAAAFDNLILQAFNTTFKFSKILRVKGSVLNLRIKIPLPGGTSTKGRHFFMNFGDTRKFLVGSLDSLCRDFKLPVCWSKLDFPITQITWKNCYHPEIKRIVEPYGINDAYALAFIIKQINRMLCLNPYEIVIVDCEEMLDRSLITDPAECYISHPMAAFNKTLYDMMVINIHTMKAPIDQFCTMMSFVKKVLNSYVNISPCSLRYRPKAVDVPALRHWVEMSLIGGRTSPYCKVYASSRFADILECWMGDRQEEVKKLVLMAVERQDTDVMLDMTSLYPTAMRYCPLPLGMIHNLTPEECDLSIKEIACSTCEDLMTLCELHRDMTKVMRPFSIILVRQFQPSPSTKRSFINLVGRKIRPITYKSSGGVPTSSEANKKSEGVSYTLETEEEATERLWGHSHEYRASDEWNVFGKTQAYTNVDLYWARECGFTFNIVGGFTWEMSGLLSELYGGLFQLRANAKDAKNQSLQLGLKNVLNGGYGVHCQKVINSTEKVIDMPPEIHDCDIRDDRVTQFIRDHHHETFDTRFILKENIPLPTKQSFVRAKIPNDLGEVLGGSSPNHVGCAVLAWSRHLMNLVMLPLMRKQEGCISYTDTDSLSLSQSMYDYLYQEKPHLMDPSGKTLGTFKNDFADKLADARILFSANGGKKVKMNIIASPDTGEITICNTYKGFMVDHTDDVGQKYTADRAGYTLSSCLLDILFDGKPSPHLGTRWSHGLGTEGVRIERGVNFSPETEAYLGHCQSFALLPPPNPHFSRGSEEKAALRIVCVPHGSTKVNALHWVPERDPVTKQLFLPENWTLFLEQYLDSDDFKQRINRTSLHQFLLKYYRFKDDLYTGTDKQEWGDITNVIQEVNAHTEMDKGKEEMEEEEEVQHCCNFPLTPDEDAYCTNVPCSLPYSPDEFSFERMMDIGNLSPIFPEEEAIESLFHSSPLLPSGLLSSSLEDSPFSFLDDTSSFTSM